MLSVPPSKLAELQPILFEATPEMAWFRSHSVKHKPIFFGRNRANRWDSVDGSFGVLYLATDEYGAFMESIGRGVLRTRFVPKALLQEKGLVQVRFRKTLRLIDLVSSGGLARVGAEGSIANSAGYKNSQRWSAALRAHPSKPDGIYYRSRHDPARTACALYESCGRHVQVVREFGAWASQTGLIAAICGHYAFGTDL